MPKIHVGRLGTPKEVVGIGVGDGSDNRKLVTEGWVGDENDAPKQFYSNLVSWSVTLEADWYDENNFGIFWIAPNNSRPQVPDGLIPVNTTRYLRRVDVQSDGDVALDFEVSQTGVTNTIDLSSDFEQNGVISLVSGNASFNLDTDGLDLEEPYLWASTTATAVFYTSVSARTGDQSAVLTLSVPR